MAEEYYNKGEVKSEELLANDSFLTDAQQYLLNRTKTLYETPEDIYAAYIEQFRVSSVNEVSALKDLAYVKSKNVSKGDKQQLGRLYLAFDNLDKADTGFFEYVKDYGEGIITAPSTWLGLMSGGVGKLAGVGGTRTAGQLVRAMATQGVKKQAAIAAGKTFAVEGAIEGGAETARQATRKDTGAQTEISKPAIVASTLAAGVLTGGIAGGVRAGRAKQAQKVQKLLDTGTAAKKSAADAADTEAEKVFKENAAFLAELRRSSPTLKKLDEATVLKGQEVKEALGEAATKNLDEPLIFSGDVTEKITDDFIISIKGATLKNITAATLDILKLTEVSIKDIKGKRITEILANTLTAAKVKATGDTHAIKEAEVSELFEGILKKYNIDYSDLQAMFLHEYSDAGRKLAEASVAKRNIQSFLELAGAAGNLPSKGGDEVGKAVDVASKLWASTKNLDAARRALMTSQPATTVRNTLNATFKTFMHGVENMTQGVAQLTIAGLKGGDAELARLGINNIKSPASLVRYLIANPIEGRAIQALYSEANPVEATKLWRAMADITEGVGVTSAKKATGKTGDKATEELATPYTSGIVNITRYLNVLNTISDNAFKRAMFASELAKEVGGVAKLNKLIEEGKFASEITDEMFERATKQALELTYQKSYERGTIANSLISFFSQPIASLAVPFPRFIANAMEYTYQHAPIIGMIETGAVFGVAGRDTSKRVAQQITGMGILGTAVMVRAAMGEETNWYESEIFKDDYNVRAALGPFAPFMIVADVIVRSWHDAKEVGATDVTDYTNPDIWKSVVSEMSANRTGRDLLESLGAGAAAGKGVVGFNLLDRSVTEIVETGGSKALVKLLATTGGNLVNSATVPAGILDDIMGSIDPAYLVKPGRTQVNFLDMLIEKSKRSMPRAPTEDERYFSPTRRGEVRKSGIVPLRGQAFGFTPLAEKNELEKEFVRLGLQDFTFYSYPTDNPRLKQQLNKMYGEMSEDVLTPFIRSKAYKFSATGRPRTRAEKRVELTRVLQEVAMGGFKPLEYLSIWARQKANQGGNNTETTSDMVKLLEDIARSKFNRLKGDDVKAARNFYNDPKVVTTGDTRSFDELTHVERMNVVKKYKNYQKSKR